jgi:hypothetical protein
MISLPKAALDHFDSKAEDLFKLVARGRARGETQEEKESSAKHKKPIVNIDNVIEMTLVGKFGPFAVQRNDELVGFLTEADQTMFSEFVTLLTKRNELSSRCSDKTIQDVCFEWCIQRVEGHVASKFSSFLVEKLSEKCKYYMFLFPIIYLEIEQGFIIGKTQIDYFTDARIEAFKNSKLIRQEDVERFKKKYSGQVNASVGIDGYDASKAEELAIQACNLSINVLKMFAPTIDDPTIRCDFGLESTVTFNPRSSAMSLELSHANGQILPKSLHLLSRSHARPFMITQDWLQRMLRNGFGLISNFLNDTPKNELSELIYQGIAFYGDAISNKNLHKRIVELFTIIESFLVRNENEPILSSITKYFPKVVSKAPEDRILVKEMLIVLYGVRSAMIHHGKQNPFDLNQLALLQEAIRIFIVNMIQHTKKHETKNSFLNEIDHAINAAY